MSENKKSRRDFFKSVAKTLVIGSFFSKSASSIGHIITAQETHLTKFPVCLNIQYILEHKKSHAEIMDDINSFSSIEKFRELVVKFQQEGKVAQHRTFVINDNGMDLKLFFKDMKAVKEYEKQLRAKNIVNIEMRQKSGYRLSTTTVQTRDVLA